MAFVLTPVLPTAETEEGYSTLLSASRNRLTGPQRSLPWAEGPAEGVNVHPEYRARVLCDSLLKSAAEEIDTASVASKTFWGTNQCTFQRSYHLESALWQTEQTRL